MNRTPYNVSVEEQALLERARAIRSAWERGDLTPEAALSEIEERLRAAQTANQRSAMAGLVNTKGALYVFWGDLDAAIAAFEQGYAIALEIQSIYQAASLKLNIGAALARQGKQNPARDAYRTAYELARDANYPYVVAAALLNETIITLQAGQFTHSLFLADEALVWIRKHLNGQSAPTPIDYHLECGIYLSLIEACIGLRECARAWDSIPACQTAATRSQSSISQAMVYRNLGQLAALCGDVPAPYAADPAGYFERALAEFESIGAEAEVGITLLHYAEVLAQQGKPDAAEQRVERAIEMLTKAKMFRQRLQAMTLRAKLRQAKQNLEQQ